MGHKDDFCSLLPQAVFFYFISVHCGKQAEGAVTPWGSFSLYWTVVVCFHHVGLGSVRGRSWQVKQRSAAVLPLGPAS